MHTNDRSQRAEIDRSKITRSEVGRSDVDLANWQEPPYNRWAYLHFGELVPTATVRRATAAPSALPSSPLDLGGVEFVDAAGRPTTVDSMLAATCTDGFLVLHEDRVVVERYFEGMTPSTTHLLQSVSKSIVASLVGILAEEDVLRPDHLVTAHIPRLRGTSYEGATVRHLLDMTAGTRFTEEYTDPDADIQECERVIGWRPGHPAGAESDLYGYIAGLPNARAHGAAFEYRSILTDLLGWVIEAATGEPLATTLSRLLWRPLGAEFDAEIAVDGSGRPISDGGVCATLRDLGRFGGMYLHEGSFDGRRVVPARWVRDCLTPDPTAIAQFALSEQAELMPGGQYRNQWWVADFDREVMMARGIHGQLIYIDRSASVVVVKVSSLPEPLDLEVSATQILGAAAIAAALGRRAHRPGAGGRD